MKSVAKVLIALLALYGAYKYYEANAPLEWPRLQMEGVNLENLTIASQLQPPSTSTATQPAQPNDSAATQPAQPNNSAAPRPGTDTLRIICPTCEGEGKLTYADGRGANHVYSCPICNGQGFRNLRLRTGQHVCPDCKGMGLTERREDRHSFGGSILNNDRNHQYTHNRKYLYAYYVRSSRCLRCNTSGAITSARTTPPNATPGVQTPQPAR